MLDRLNHISLAWIPVLILATFIVGAALAWLTGGRR